MKSFLDHKSTRSEFFCYCLTVFMIHVIIEMTPKTSFHLQATQERKGGSDD
jgi:hypothetical protein